LVEEVEERVGELLLEGVEEESEARFLLYS
jgi:hypothetical protein